MSYEESLRSVSLDADSSLAKYTGVPGVPGSADPNYGNMYRFVKVTGAHAVGLAVANTDVVVGVMQNKPQVTGQAATVAIRGISNVLAGGAFAAGDPLTTDAQGRAVKREGTGTVLAIAIEPATAENTLAPALLRIN